MLHKRQSPQTKVWLTSGNHNFLRITRILHCLNVMGLSQEATAFYNALQQIYTEDAAKTRQVIGASTFGYWTEAASP